MKHWKEDFTGVQEKTSAPCFLKSILTGHRHSPMGLPKEIRVTRAGDLGELALYPHCFSSSFS